MDLSVPVIQATARQGRSSIRASEFVVDYLEQSSHPVSVDLVDVRDFPFAQTYEAWNEHPDQPEVARWREIAEAADGYIIVAPEYNHGMPGELKLLLDSAFEEYFDKPVGLVGVSAGGFGGARVVESIKPTLIELGMTVAGSAVYTSNVDELLSEGGDIDEDRREDYTDQIDAMAEELIRYGQVLKQMREK